MYSKPRQVYKIPVRGMAVMDRIPIFINTPEDAYTVTKAWHNRRQEHLLVLTLGVNDKLIKIHCVAKGSIRNVALTAREIFYPAIRDNASCIIVCHNRPDGMCKPSSQDLDSAMQVQMAGEILGIRVWDEMILTKNEFFSLRRNGPFGYKIVNEYGTNLDNMRKFMGSTP
jgi:DNA repair protein RadC